MATGSSSTSAPRRPTPNPSQPSEQTNGKTHRGSHGQVRAQGRFWPKLTVHAAALFCVLIGLLLFVSTDAVWTSDEGALLYQAQQLLTGQGWEVAHPFPDADPQGTQFPIELTVWGSNGGYLPYSRHAALVWLVGAVYAIAGYSGVITMSILGTVGASTVAAKLGHLINSNPDTKNRTGIVALWCTGLGSPMLFNSFIAWAHTLVAALLCWAFYVLARHSQAQPSPTTSISRHRWRQESVTLKIEGSSRASVLVGFVLIVAACLLRTEAVLAGFAIGLGLLGLHRATKASGVPFAGVTALTGAVTGFIVDKSLNPAGEGPLKPASFDDVYGLVDGRLAGFYQTWLRPTTGTGLTSLLLLVGAMLVIASGVLARRYRSASSSADQSSGPLLFAAIGVGLVVAATAVLSQVGSSSAGLPSVLVPGLLVAFPSLFSGLSLTTKADIKNPVLLAALVTCGLFWLSVIATQYRFGGGAEWGGRYFAATLPLAVPVAVVNCQKLVERRTSSLPVVFVGLLLTSQLLFGFLGVSRIRSSRSELAYLDTKVTEAEQVLAGPGGGPVFVTTVPPAGRWMWDHLDDGRWLWVEPEELETTMSRLAELGISQVGLISFDQENDLASSAKHYQLQPEADPSEPVLILQNK